jgi:hypothetical protein
VQQHRTVTAGPRIDPQEAFAQPRKGIDLCGPIPVCHYRQGMSPLQSARQRDKTGGDTSLTVLN